MENYRNIGESNNNAQSNFNKEEAYLRAKKKFDKLKGFYWHLAAYVVVNIFLIITVTTHLDENESFWQFETFATAMTDMVFVMTSGAGPAIVTVSPLRVGNISKVELTP